MLDDERSLKARTAVAMGELRHFGSQLREALRSGSRSAIGIAAAQNATAANIQDLEARLRDLRDGRECLVHS